MTNIVYMQAFNQCVRLKKEQFQNLDSKLTVQVSDQALNLIHFQSSPVQLGSCVRLVRLWSLKGVHHICHMFFGRQKHSMAVVRVD